KTVPWLERLPSEYVREHVRLTTQPIEEPENPDHLKAMLGMFDAANMLMFSSAYPHWDGDTPSFSARPFSKELRPRVMSDTARELYRLPASAANPVDIAEVSAASVGALADD
ncbi:MAG: amidohydrolase family protein, partial [Thermomicrobiales bacterium]